MTQSALDRARLYQEELTAIRRDIHAQITRHHGVRSKGCYRTCHGVFRFFMQQL